MTFVKALQSFNPEKLEGMILPAVVIDNNDPDQDQKVKCRIATLHNNIVDDHLPWSKQIGTNGQGNTGQVGAVSVPIIGARGFVWFPEDDNHNTYYIGANNYSSTHLNELLEDYPNSYGHIDAANNLFKVNTTQKTWTMYLAQGHKLFFDNLGCTLTVAGNMKMEVVGDYSVHTTGNINMSADGQFNLFSTGNMNLTGAAINENSGSGASVSTGLTVVTRPAVASIDVSNKTSY